MRKILVFAGTRPEIIKMAPVYRALRKLPDYATGFCFSGQHLELALPFLRYFGIEPEYEMNLMAPGQSLGQLTSRAAAQFDSFFEKERDVAAVLVQGDTTTAMMAALTAFYHKIPVGHVEAGLRTSSITEPFPEELNRRMISRIASWHYAPTRAAVSTLRAEQVPAKDIALTGNSGIDALVWAAERQAEPEMPQLMSLRGKRFALVTAHRRENIGAPLQEITQAIRTLADAFPDVAFLLPVHKNPAVSQTLRGNLGGLPNCLLVDPLDYGDLVWAMKNAELILTDSGGIQEEAPTFRKPVLVLRNETERPEALEYGTSFLVGPHAKRIVSAARAFLTGRKKLKLKRGPNPFGDGKAAEKIAFNLTKSLKR